MKNEITNESQSPQSELQTQEEKEQLKKGVIGYLRNLFDIRGDMMSQPEIDEMMQENTVIHGSNMWILILAMLIACIGLYTNSVVTLIGAMLISPLMNGIITMGYSLGVRDLSMLGKAFKRFLTQVVISLVAATIFFLIAKLDEPTAEMLARTSPTFWDVLIALFGGVAGMIGNTRQKKGNVIPGVAIATALMPPLCTAGYGLATWQLKIFIGALYLFLINALLIAMAAWIVTNVLRIPNRVQLDVKKRRKINFAAAMISLLVVVPSILTGALTIYNARVDNSIERYLESEFTFSGTLLVQSSINKTEKKINVALVGKTISTETVDLLQKQLSNYGLDGYTLTVTQNSVWDGEENSDKITIAIQENTISQLEQQVDEQKKELDELKKSLAAKVDFKKIADKADDVFADYLHTSHCGILSDNDVEYVILLAHHKKELTQEEKTLIENWLRVESGAELVMLFTYD